ncbi:MAG: phage holin family protein [Bacteroidia bacterium]|nr:phage holin family protein [Bacteroidia bacterium]
MKILYQASKWAKINPISARLLITFATIISVGIHYYGGLYLFAHDIIFPYPLAVIFSLISISGILLYPRKKTFKAGSSRNFRKRKALDFLIFFCGALMVVFLANRRAAEVWTDPELSINTEQLDSQSEHSSIHFTSSVHPKNLEEAPSSLTPKELRKQMKKQFKELRKLIKTELKDLKARRKKGETGTGAKVLLTILTIALAIGLGMLVVALACSVSCNGNETLGAVILIIGWAGILFLAFYFIKRIFSSDGPRPRPPKPEDSSYPY